jgi:hypothetical protein
MTDNNKTKPAKTPLESYREIVVGKTLYRVTSVFLGEVELGKALEDLTVSRILRKIEDNRANGQR